jgi:hypothetical protein
MLVQQSSCVKFGFIYYTPLSDKLMRKGDLTHRIYAAPPLLPLLKMLVLTPCSGGEGAYRGGGGGVKLRLFLSILIQQSFNLNRSLAFKVMSTHKRRPDISRKLTGRLS